ncbi:MAG TPA: hypothetical protein DIC59_01875, partial [Candidatus Competibacteraceae bacterium]|nr:hypothetical protein [Candidatus Competibacteraceae bacterium]
GGDAFGFRLSPGFRGGFLGGLAAGGFLLSLRFLSGPAARGVLLGESGRVALGLAGWRGLNSPRRLGLWLPGGRWRGNLGYGGRRGGRWAVWLGAGSYSHLRGPAAVQEIVCRLLPSQNTTD